jgi:hypothetical protein
MATLSQPVAVPVGAIKQFGPWGPEYEVLAEATPRGDKRMARIVIVRTGEELDYPMEHILQEPEAK